MEKQEWSKGLVSRPACPRRCGCIRGCSCASHVGGLRPFICIDDAGLEHVESTLLIETFQVRAESHLNAFDPVRCQRGHGDFDECSPVPASLAVRMYHEVDKKCVADSIADDIQEPN